MRDIIGERSASTLRPPNQLPVREVSMAVKQCTKCGEIKPLELFYKQQKGKDGHAAHCAECAKKKAMEWHNAHREEILAKNTAKHRARGVMPRKPKNPDPPSYYQRMKSNPEYLEKRKAYAAKRFKEKRQQIVSSNLAWRLSNPEKAKAIDRAARDRNQLLYIYRNIRKRAKKRGLEFNIEYADLVVPEVCPIFGVPFVYKATMDNYDFAPSVDRIDSSKGYVKGNVQVISRLANCMKWTATPEQLIAFARGILKAYS